MRHQFLSKCQRYFLVAYVWLAHTSHISHELSGLTALATDSARSSVFNATMRKKKPDYVQGDHHTILKICRLKRGQQGRRTRCANARSMQRRKIRLCAKHSPTVCDFRAQRAININTSFRSHDSTAVDMNIAARYKKTQKAQRYRINQSDC